MRRAVALLAAVLALAVIGGCGDDGAEPGAPFGAVLVLDFAPNAAHSGLYAAAARGFFEDEGVALEIAEPGESSDGPKLLAADRVEFAVLDIHDLGIARERGLDVVGLTGLVQRPLAAILAADPDVRRPRDLEGRRVGVTGLPSDEAVVDSAVAADGGDPDRVQRVTIGFNAVASLAAGKVDAATGFWNAEGVALRRRGIPLRVFKVDRYGAPPYPELVLATSATRLREDPEAVAAVVAATERGYALACTRPDAALDDLLAAVPALDRAEQEAQRRALGKDLCPRPLRPDLLRAWAAWDQEHAILRRPLDTSAAFPLADLKG